MSKASGLLDLIEPLKRDKDNQQNLKEYSESKEEILNNVEFHLALFVDCLVSQVYHSRDDAPKYLDNACRWLEVLESLYGERVCLTEKLEYVYPFFDYIIKTELAKHVVQEEE